MEVNRIGRCTEMHLAPEGKDREGLYRLYISAKEYIIIQRNLFSFLSYYLKSVGLSLILV